MDTADELPKITVFVVEETNPSSYFFIFPRLDPQTCQVIRCGYQDIPEPAALTDAVVIFVRYLPAGWVKLIDVVRHQLKALVFFMDDDVLDWKACRGMPLIYRYKLAKLAWIRRGWLQRQQPKLWVSTPYLLKKYADWRPQLVKPMVPMLPQGLRRIFYHGTIATHQAEIRWLRPIIAEVLKQDPNTTFEIIGKSAEFRLYKGLPRVTVVQPLKWPAYQSFLAIPGRHIGLNPLLDVPFNRARSYTKFFDITRCGAVGIYSQQSECAEAVTHENEGLVLPLDPEAWVSAILKLSQDEEYRRGLWLNAENKMRVLSVAAQANPLQ